MIRIGLVGFGYWGPNLARAFSETETATVEMIADSSASARERAARRHPSARLTADWRDLLTDGAVDAIVVATPADTHFDIGIAALRASKHVLIEKPLAETPVKARLLVEEAARRGLTLMVDHTFVYTGAISSIKEMIDSGQIGDIYYYDSTRVNFGLFQRDVNVIWDLAVHDFAILNHLLAARPVAISASAAGFVADSPESMAHLSIYFDDGALAHLNVNWLAPVKIRQTLIGGSRQMVIYDDMQTSEKVKVYDRGIALSDDPRQTRDRMISYRIGDMHAPALSAKEALLTEAQEFVRCVETGARSLTDGESGLRVVEMLDAATRSMRMRGRPIDLIDLRQAS